MVYKTSSDSLNTLCRSYAKSNLRRLEYDVIVAIKENEKVTATIEKQNIQVSIDYIPEISKTSSANEQRIKEAFAKTEETSVRFNTSCDIQEGLFVPASKFNELRKAIVEKLEETKLVRQEIKNINIKLQDAIQTANNEQKKQNSKKYNSLYVYKYNKEIDYVEYYKNKYNKKLDIIYINPSDFAKYEQDIIKYIDRCKIYFVISNVTLKNTAKYILNNLENLCQKGISGILLGNIGYIPLCNELKQKYNMEIIADYSLNVMNKYTANKLKELGIDRVTPLFENDNIDLDSINNILPIEIVQDMATVMTTRYCVIASFVKDISGNKKCGVECRKNNYYLIDELNKRYDILTDSFDCITRYVRNKRQYADEQEALYSTRHCVIK